MSAAVLTIDLGTSGPKAALVDADGRVLGSARASVTTHFGPEGAAEQDPVEVWRATVDACRRAVADAGPAGRGCIAVIASSQYSSIVPVDADGEAVLPMITWMDGRGSPRRLRAAGAPRANPAHLADWFRRHGLAPVEAGISLNHLRWVRHARPDAYARTAAFLEPADYLTLRLTGRATANPCTAFMYLLTDNRTPTPTTWDAALARHAGIDVAKLPELVPAGSDVGAIRADVAAELGIPAGTRVLSGLNDTQAGAVASGAATGDGAGLSLGTTAVIAARCDRHRADPRTSVFAAPGPCPTAGAGYLMSAENGIAGAALEHVSTLLYPHHGEPAERYAELAADGRSAPPGAGGVLFLPWLRGALAPAADGRMRGGFLNVGLEHGRGHLARAVLEGISLNVRRLRGPAERYAGRRFTEFTVYGGGAQSDLWCQVLADVLQTPVRQLDRPGHANCVGVGLFAFARLGVLADADLAGRVAVRQTYRPDPATGPVYDELADRFAEAFRATRPLFHHFHDARKVFR